MEIIILAIVCVIAIIVIAFPVTSSIGEDVSLYDDVPHKFYEDKEEEEMFYHPVTGYKGNKVNMDAYIQNREKELKRDSK